MGASSSTAAAASEASTEEREAASVGALPFLQKSFSSLTATPAANDDGDVDHPQSNSNSTIPVSSLQQCFSLTYTNISCEGAVLPDSFRGILDHFGNAIVDTLFVTGKGGISWVEFLRGYLKCCGRMPASSLLNALFRVVALSAERAGCPLKLNFESDEVDSKTSGSVSPLMLGMILWLCWIMSWSSTSPRDAMGKEDVSIPDLNPLVLSAIVSCSDVGGDIDVWNADILSLDVELTVGKIHTWALRTVPNITDCFSQFVSSRLKIEAPPEELSSAGTSSMLAEETLPAKAFESHLLTRGRAWALSLSQRNSCGEEILKICFPGDSDEIEESLIYRSYIHGKGLSRFWSNVEGYHGPVLMLISASSGESSESSRKWIIGALTQQGFENRDVFYGTGGCLYSICPVFQALSSSGKEQNYLYSHLHPAVRRYEAHPMPVGIAFGGTPGNERIFIDEDFSKITVRHHAADKTYQPGSLFPDQGYLPVEASILEVEVWGLGGKTSKDVQDSYKKREQLFTEQRRKIDLKTFANWEDSPEKMMMEMMTNPNTVRREDR